MKRRLLEDEAIFLENNKERLRKIWEKKDKRIADIDLDESSDESTEEENFQSDFVAI